MPRDAHTHEDEHPRLITHEALHELMVNSSVQFSLYPDTMDIMEDYANDEARVLVRAVLEDGNGNKLCLNGIEVEFTVDNTDNDGDDVTLSESKVKTDNGVARTYAEFTGESYTDTDDIEIDINDVVLPIQTISGDNTIDISVESE